MSYEILRTEAFSKHLKQLAKKYPSIKTDYAALLDSLQKERMKISSKNTGKSGGVRVITFVKIELKTITLLDIYNKSEKENITDGELAALLKKVAE